MSLGCDGLSADFSGCPLPVKVVSWLSLGCDGLSAGCDGFQQVLVAVSCL